MFFLLFCNHKGNELGNGSNQKLDRPQPAELFVFMDMETSIEVLTLIWKTVSGRITFPLSKRLFLKYVALIFLIFILYFESACSAACSLWHFVLTFLSQRFFFFTLLCSGADWLLCLSPVILMSDYVEGGICPWKIFCTFISEKSLPTEDTKMFLYMSM